jgi:ketosteroid isomerase-like protein
MDDRDTDAILACFTDDAVVIDEGQTMRGHADIRRWREKGAAAAYEYTVELRGSQPGDAGEYVVTTRLEGNFPGSPVDLKFRFRLRADLIDHLEIAP